MEHGPRPPRQRELNESSLIESTTFTTTLTEAESPYRLEAQFTRESYSVFHPKDLGPDDRLYVYTDSGNVYRIEQSKSRPELLRIHNERTGNSPQYSTAAPNEDPLISAGKPFYFAELIDPDDYTQGGNVYNTSPVDRIEVVRRYNEAYRDAKRFLSDQSEGDAKDFGASAASGLSHATGAKGTRLEGIRDYTVEPDEASE